MTNSSLSNGLNVLATESAAAGGSKVKESCTISTQDSLKKAEKKSSKRGSKKKSKKSSSSLEASLTNLSMEDAEASNAEKMDAPTVATTDSREAKEKKEKQKSRRGGKKKALIDLETSLTELLTDEEESESPTVRESFTVSTLDSLDKNKLSGRSKRGAKKATNLGSVLGKLEGPKDFGRDCDDNDTFCGLGTVGEKELAKGPKSSSKSPNVRKTKIISPRQKKLSSGGAGAFGNMMMPTHDSDSEEEDLFESFESNPFRVPY